MSKRYQNYSQQYNKPNEPTPVNTVNETFVAGVIPEPMANVDPEPTVITPSDDPIYGTVVRCKALNVREEASVDSEKVCVLPAGSRVVVDNIDSAGEWFSICTEAGLEGYCLSEYISIEG